MASSAMLRGSLEIDSHLQANVETALKGICLQAPIDLLLFPEESADRFLRGDSQIEITHSDLVWVRLT